MKVQETMPYSDFVEELEDVIDAPESEKSVILMKIGWILTDNDQAEVGLAVCHRSLQRLIKMTCGTSEDMRDKNSVTNLENLANRKKAFEVYRRALRNLEIDGEKGRAKVFHIDVR